MDLTAKNFWRRGAQRSRVIEVLDARQMTVDGQVVSIPDWLRQHEAEWLEQWERWRQAVALCGLGDFHWTDHSETSVIDMPVST